MDRNSNFKVLTQNFLTGSGPQTSLDPTHCPSLTYSYPAPSLTQGQNAQHKTTFTRPQDRREIGWVILTVRCNLIAKLLLLPYTHSLRTPPPFLWGGGGGGGGGGAGYCHTSSSNKNTLCLVSWSASSFLKDTRPAAPDFALEGKEKCIKIKQVRSSGTDTEHMILGKTEQEGQEKETWTLTHIYPQTFPRHQRPTFSATCCLGAWNALIPGSTNSPFQFALKSCSVPIRPIDGFSEHCVGFLGFFKLLSFLRQLGSQALDFVLPFLALFPARDLLANSTRLSTQLVSRYTLWITSIWLARLLC